MISTEESIKAAHDYLTAKKGALMAYCWYHKERPTAKERLEKWRKDFKQYMEITRYFEL